MAVRASLCQFRRTSELLCHPEAYVSSQLRSGTRRDIGQRQLIPRVARKAADHGGVALRDSAQCGVDFGQNIRVQNQVPGPDRVVKLSRNVTGPADLGEPASRKSDVAQSDASVCCAVAESGTGSKVRIELLHIDDCPHMAKALEQVEAALNALGRQDIRVHVRHIKTPADTAGTGFAGSPTITADGVDIFPDGAPKSNA